MSQSSFKRGSVVSRMLAGLAFPKQDRAMAWQLVSDIVAVPTEVEEALEVAASIFEAKKKKGIAKRLRSIRRAIGQDKFEEAMANFAPGPEGGVFTVVGGADLGKMFAGAARILRIQQKINQAVVGAVVPPFLVFFLVFLSVLFAGRNLFPILVELVSLEKLDSLNRWIVEFCLWFGQNPFVIFVVLGAVLFAIGLSVPLYVGRGRDYLDNLPPWSLFRMVTGSAFVMAIVESARAGHDINRRFLSNMAKRLGRYSQMRVSRIAKGLTSSSGNIGTSCLKHGAGFPDHDLNAVWSAFDKREDWVEPLDRFLERWLEDVEVKAKQNAAVLRTVMMAFAAISLGLMGSAALSVVTAATSQGGF